MVGEAVILAAGIASRMGSVGRGAKFAVTVGGRPLIHYPVMSLASAGVKRFCVVVRSAVRHILDAVVAGLDHGIEFAVVENNEWWRENGYSLLRAAEVVTGWEFLLSMCDHIYPAEVVLRLVEEAEKHPDAAVIVAGDRSPAYVDVEEATLIFAPGGVVRRIGKGLPRWNYVDAGVFLMRRPIFEVARALAERREVVRLSEVVEAAARAGLGVRVADITGLPWTEVDTADDYYEVTRGSKRVLLVEVMAGWRS